MRPGYPVISACRLRASSCSILISTARARSTPKASARRATHTMTSASSPPRLSRLYRPALSRRWNSSAPRTSAWSSPTSSPSLTVCASAKETRPPRVVGSKPKFAARRRARPSANCARSRRLRSAAGVVSGMLIMPFKALEVPEEPVVDLADSVYHRQMAISVADVCLGARDGGGQPLPVLHGNEPVLAAVPDLDRHSDVAEVKSPVPQLRGSIVPPALVARGERDLMGLGQPSEQVPVQHLRVGGRDEALQVRAELLRRGREDLLDTLAQIEAGRLWVGEEQLKALDVGVAHPVVKVEALDPVGRERSHRRDRDRHIWQQRCAPQRERPAAGYAPNADPVVSERLGDAPDILSVRRHRVTGLRG